MPGDKKTNTPRLIAPRMMSSSNINLPKQDMISAVSSAGKAVSCGIQGASDQLLAAIQGVYYPPNTCYDYYYHGYNSPFSPSNDKSYFKTEPIYQTQPSSPIKKFGSGSPSSGLIAGFHPTFGVERDEYNLKEFRTEYDNAKFYVIKSYTEDDIHKCIKYNVWSSTLHGNKKLDAGLREAEDKTKETGKTSPVFLFFSVNRSGQFVGVAEMIGRVDFSTDMDFWQLDIWPGYFPVKWHIIKDVPNMLLRHIILENNENKPVTYSRDTQEIGLEQGLAMLRIFKSYPEKTSVLDDFNFYELQEEAIKVKRKTKPASRTNGSKCSDYKKHFEGGEGIISQQSLRRPISRILML